MTRKLQLSYIAIHSLSHHVLANSRIYDLCLPHGDLSFEAVSRSFSAPSQGKWHKLSDMSSHPQLMDQPSNTLAIWCHNYTRCSFNFQTAHEAHNKIMWNIVSPFELTRRVRHSHFRVITRGAQPTKMALYRIKARGVWWHFWSL